MTRLPDFTVVVKSERVYNLHTATTHGSAMASIFQLKNGQWRAQCHISYKRFSKCFPTKAQAEAWVEMVEVSEPTIMYLRRAIEDHRISSAIPRRLREAISKANYSAVDIMRCSVGLGEGAGVYFLIRDYEVIYVGQTDNLLRRLYQHQRDGRKFSSFAFIPCERECLNDLEQTYITLLLPKHNMTFGETRAKKAA